MIVRAALVMSLLVGCAAGATSAVGADDGTDAGPDAAPPFGLGPDPGATSSEPPLGCYGCHGYAWPAEATRTPCRYAIPAGLDPVKHLPSDIVAFVAFPREWDQGNYRAAPTCGDDFG